MDPVCRSGWGGDRWGGGSSWLVLPDTVEEVVDMEVEVATMIGEVEEDMVVGTMIGDRVDTMIGLEEEATEETVVGTEEDVEDELPKKAVSTKLDPKDMPWSTAPEKGNAWT
eukprot:scaffold14247_cov207-Alexandrium_tamarense.AAC.6